MLLLDEGLSYEGFYAYQLVCSTSAFAETTLYGSGKLLLLRYHSSLIDHVLHYFTNTACKSNGMVTGWVYIIFARFWYWNKI